MSAVIDKSTSPVTVSTTELIALNRKCRGLSLKTGLVSALQSGDYQSAFKGRGMEYDESRLYQPGDDIRNIDWRVTARSGKPHTKLFREERERPVHLWVDLRQPMFFATRGKYKAVRVAELAALFAWTANKQGDRVGGIVFSDEEHHELKPQRGRLAVLRLFNTIVESPGWHKQDTNLNPKSEYRLDSLLNLRRLARPGSLVILLSDFRGFDARARSNLAALRQHNEVMMVHIYDPFESVLPPAGYYRITDGAKQMHLDTTDASLISEYQQRFQQHRDNLLNTARKYHINYLSCRTDEAPEKIIREGLYQR